MSSVARRPRDVVACRGFGSETMNSQMENTDREQTDAQQKSNAETNAGREDGGAGGASLSAEEVQSLKAEAEKARHYYDQWVRTTADLDNYKKRATRER